MKIKIEIKGNEYELDSSGNRIPSDDIKIEIDTENENISGYTDGSTIKVSADGDVGSNHNKNIDLHTSV